MPCCWLLLRRIPLFACCDEPCAAGGARRTGAVVVVHVAVVVHVHVVRAVAAKCGQATDAAAHRARAREADRRSPRRGTGFAADQPEAVSSGLARGDLPRVEHSMCPT